MKRFVSIIVLGVLLSVSSCIGARRGSDVKGVVDTLPLVSDTARGEVHHEATAADIPVQVKKLGLFDFLTFAVAIFALVASVVELLLLLRLNGRNEERLDSHSDRIKNLELYSLEKNQFSKLFDSSFQKSLPLIETKVEELFNKEMAILSLKKEDELMAGDVVEAIPPAFPSESFYGDYNPSYNGFPLDYLDKSAGKAFIIETRSETEAKYRLVDGISPTMIQSALAGCIYEGDSQHYNQVVNTQEGSLFFNKDMNAWIVKQKVKIVFK